MSPPPEFRAPLIALAASLGLILVYVAFGGGTYEPDRVADPCQTRSEQVLAERDLFEAIALSSLDGAACELGVSREELTIALADEASTQQFANARGIDEETVNDAVRAGLQRAVSDAREADRLGTFEAAALDRIIEYAPVGTIITALQRVSGSDSVQDLLSELWDLGQLEIPGIDSLPGIDQLPDLGNLQELLP